MQLLNANSYQKGGWILQMLRLKLGEDAFWKGMRSYYAKYNGGNANTDELRIIMERESGKDLKQFFKQWLNTPGNLKLNIGWKYIAAKNVVELNIAQNQDALFEFPLQIALDKKHQDVSIKQRITVIQVPVNRKPTSVTADPNVNLLASFSVAEEN